MHVVEIALLMLLGSALANLLDSIFEITPRIASWLQKVIDPLF